jgi:glyoxylase-like metal-dependent hydrolase (beta-lactamase superfamily II)
MLTFLVDQPAPFAEPVPVAEGVFWLRMPIPYRLNHVNLFLVREGDGFTLVDTGVDDAPTRDHWRTILASLDGTVRRIIVTHHHPDHCGAAGWLQGQTGAPVLATPVEWACWEHDVLKDTPELRRDLASFYRWLGASPSRSDAMALLKISSWDHMGPLPRQRGLLEPGVNVELGGTSWSLLPGKGHSPGPALLLDRERGLLLAGDQVLPSISPYIGTSPFRPRQSPLADYRAFLEGVVGLDGDPVVLPGHGLPFRGLAERCRDLLEHHRERCEAIAETTIVERSVLDLVGLHFKGLPDDLTFMALEEVLSHVNAMILDGTIATHDVEGVLRVRSSPPDRTARLS